MSNFINEKFEGNYKSIFNFLQEKAITDLIFADKLNNSKQTAKDLKTYIESEARKSAKNGCAMIADEVVYGWAIHFIDENIKGNENATTKKFNSSIKRTAKESIKRLDNKQEDKPRRIKGRNDKSVEGQVSLFDF